MDILIAGTDIASRRAIENILGNTAHRITSVAHGRLALEHLSGPGGPRLAFLDRNLPGMSGPEVCRQVRAQNRENYVYLVLLDSWGSAKEATEALESGADDCLITPFQDHELKAKLRAGERIVRLEEDLLEARRAAGLKATRDLHAQKLEAVGGLAAGIAHEINTPIQFVSDNTRFLQESFRTMADLIAQYQAAAETLGRPDALPELLERLRTESDKADWAYLRTEVPKALDQMLEGLGRVTMIVSAMKEFSHVDRNTEKAPADLNRALESTLVVARNELKYVADVETEYGNVPPILCHLGDLNQVFLNLFVNAAHAIDDVVKGTGKRGRIVVRTRHDGDCVEVTISDTGTGIAPEIRGKIFDPFFTTKEVGRGTGQGLSLARAIVVDKHGGTLTFDTEMGKGTTFRVRLPLAGAARPEEIAVP